MRLLSKGEVQFQTDEDEAVISSEPAIAQTPKSILEVTEVSLSVLKSFPPQLQIVASGTHLINGDIDSL